MRTSKKTYGLIILLALALFAVGCGSWSVAENAVARHYLIPQWGVITSYDDERIAVLPRDTVCVNRAGGSFTIKRGYSSDGRLILYCDQLRGVQKVQLIVGDNTVDGFCTSDGTEISFSDKALEKRDILAAPVTLRVNGDPSWSVELPLTQAVGVDSLGALGQAVSANDISTIAILDDDGRGLVLAAVNDEPRAADMLVKPQTVRAYDRAGQAYELKANDGPYPWQHYELPQALWDNLAYVEVQDVKITYTRRILRQMGDKPYLKVPLPDGQESGQLDQTLYLGDYPIEVTSFAYQPSEEKIRVGLFIPQQQERPLQSISLAISYGSGTSVAAAGLEVSYSVSQRCVLGHTLWLPIDSYDVLQKGTWRIDMPKTAQQEAAIER